jgi:hypothetical protein
MRSAPLLQRGAGSTRFQCHAAALMQGRLVVWPHCMPKSSKRSLAQRAVRAPLRVRATRTVEEDTRLMPGDEVEALQASAPLSECAAPSTAPWMVVLGHSLYVLRVR